MRASASVDGDAALGKQSEHARERQKKLYRYAVKQEEKEMVTRQTRRVERREAEAAPAATPADSATPAATLSGSRLLAATAPLQISHRAKRARGAGGGVVGARARARAVREAGMWSIGHVAIAVLSHAAIVGSGFVACAERRT